MEGQRPKVPGYSGVNCILYIVMLYYVMLYYITLSYLFLQSNTYRLGRNERQRQKKAKEQKQAEVAASCDTAAPDLRSGLGLTSHGA